MISNKFITFKDYQLLVPNVIVVFMLGITFVVDLSLAHFAIFRCPLYNFVGVPCPMCGMTRAVFAFVKGDFIQVVDLNWSFYLFVILGLVLFFKPILKFRYLNYLIVGLGLLILCLFLVRLFLVFPNHEVLNYNYDAFLMRMLKGKL